MIGIQRYWKFSINVASNILKNIKHLLCLLGTPLPYDTLDELRNRIDDIAPHLTRWGKLEPAETYNGVADQVAEVTHNKNFKNLILL